MAISLFASFRTYVLFSVLLTTAILSHAFYTKKFFYRSVVYLAKSKLAILAVGNMALVFVLLIWRLVQVLFLGPLRFRERERLHIRARDAVIESCFAMSVFREEFNLTFVALITTLLLIKSLHWLSKDRIEFLEEQPLSPRRAHVRVVCLMAFLLCTDLIFVARSIQATLSLNGTMYSLFTFEYSILIVELLADYMRYIFLVIDLSMDGRWEAKSLYSFYVELLSDLCQLTVYIIFFIYVKVYYSFPYHIIREMYMTFHKLRRRFFDFLRYRRVVATMNDLFADATDEELAEGDRTCIICREEMVAAKKLDCGHMFHARCLQSWLKRQLSCPTCRANIDVNAPARDGRDANEANARDANANPGGNANGDGNADVNANDNRIPNGADRNLADAIVGNAPRNDDIREEARARLVNDANQWWQGLMDDAGVAAAPAAGADAARPAALGHARPPQRVLGPNAAAHMHLRQRRRMAWGQLPFGGVAGQPNGNVLPPANGIGIPYVFPGPHGQLGEPAGPLFHPYPLQRQNGQHRPGGPAAPGGPATSTGAPSSTNPGQDVGARSGGGMASAVTNVEANTAAHMGSGIDPNAQSGGTSSVVAAMGELTCPYPNGLLNFPILPDTAQHGSVTSLSREAAGQGVPVLINKLPLARLLSIQEQIEVLRAEVESLVVLATNSTADEHENADQINNGGHIGQNSPDSSSLHAPATLGETSEEKQESETNSETLNVGENDQETSARRE